MAEEVIKQSLGGVLHSMDQLNDLFEARLLKLRQEEVDESDIRRLEQGVLAMKDAGRLYVTWADHFIDRLNETEMYDEMLE